MKFNPSPASQTMIEPMLPLINIVFLLLIFFMVSATIAPPMQGITPVEQLVEDPLDMALAPQHQWFKLSKTGVLMRDLQVYQPSDIAKHLRDNNHIRIIADGAITTAKLKQISSDLSLAGIEQITLVTRLASAESHQ